MGCGIWNRYVKKVESLKKEKKKEEKKSKEKRREGE
jgi:hypothetical protein